MAGIVFVRTKDLEKIVEFYIAKVGMSKWVEQPDIMILRHENLLLGFHQQNSADTDSLFTFFYETKDEVDNMYQKLEEITIREPKVTEKYKIYNFFAKDPEGRTIEFQQFLHELPEF